MPNIVLGISGSVAAYRACDLARELMRMGHTVRVCLTDSGAKFVTPALFEALTGQPCLQDSFEEPDRGRMAHIEWGKEADVLVVAPATANVMCKLATGVADDMLTTLAHVYQGRIVIAPAMNPAMYESDAVRAARDVLAARAAVFVEPDEGQVACGDEGRGKFASVERIAAAVASVAGLKKALERKRVLITSGPTQEPIDAARYLSNRSSGKMGAALARAALLMGAQVTVVSGPASAPLPRGCVVVPVRTAQQMLDAARAVVRDVDWVVGAAAVADYRVEKPFEGKLRRSAEPIDLRLVPNPDVIRCLAEASRPETRVVGFAAEPTDDLDEARRKLERKGLWAIATNDVSRADAGFEADTNDLSLVFADGRVERSGLMPKLDCAIWLFERLAGRVS